MLHFSKGRHRNIYFDYFGHLGRIPGKMASFQEFHTNPGAKMAQFYIFLVIMLRFDWASRKIQMLNILSNIYPNKAKRHRFGNFTQLGDLQIYLFKCQPYYYFI